MKEELDRFVKYINGATVHYQGNDTNICMFRDLLHSGKLNEYECPDIFLCNENIVFIIEHFEFDCYKRNRKGSSQHKEIARIDNEMSRMSPDEKGVCYHDILHGNKSYENYINNAIYGFKKHYNQIDLYYSRLKKDGIINDNSEVKVLFFIEDITSLGSAVLRENEEGFDLVTLAKSKEFLDLFSRSPRVDYVLACSSFGNDRIVWFIDRNQIDEYLNKSEDYECKQFIFNNPQVLSFLKHI